MFVGVMVCEHLRLYCVQKKEDLGHASAGARTLWAVDMRGDLRQWLCIRTIPVSFMYVIHLYIKPIYMTMWGLIPCRTFSDTRKTFFKCSTKIYPKYTLNICNIHIKHLKKYMYIYISCIKKDIMYFKKLVVY